MSISACYLFKSSFEFKPVAGIEMVARMYGFD